MPPKPVAPRLTHFLCLPLVTLASKPQLQASLGLFCADISKGTPKNPGGIPEKAIRPVGTLHLTLGVMTLLTPARVQEALTVLKSLNLKDLLMDKSAEPARTEDPTKHDFTSLEETPQASEPLHITLRGLESMHKTSKTSILYTSPVDADKRLYSFCNRLKSAFEEADLLVPDKRPLLLHATLVNTVYVPPVKGKGLGREKNRARLTIDASELLRSYKETEWMRDVRVEKVAICRMGAVKRENGEEEYVMEGEIEIPV